jgi:NitT/TauT family transport system permease protein
MGPSEEAMPEEIPTLTKAIYLSAKYDVPLEMINKSYTLGGSNMEVMWLYAFREILPKVLESIRLQIGPSLVYLIAAEYNNAQVGFGYRIRIQQRLLHMDTVYLYVIILAILGYSLSTGVTLLRKWWCPWFERSK